MVLVPSRKIFSKIVQIRIIEACPVGLFLRTQCTLGAADLGSGGKSCGSSSMGWAIRLRWQALLFVALGLYIVGLV